jgi:hypothetical protein
MMWVLYRGDSVVVNEGQRNALGLGGLSASPEIAEIRSPITTMSVILQCVFRLGVNSHTLNQASNATGLSSRG